MTTRDTACTDTVLSTSLGYRSSMITMKRDKDLTSDMCLYLVLYIFYITYTRPQDAGVAGVQRNKLNTF